MSNPCGGLTLSPSNNAICSPGYIAGVYLFEDKPAAQTEANAALEATWAVFAKADMPDRLFKIKFDNVEPAEPEIVEEEYSDGSKAIVQTKQGSNRFELISSLGALKTIYEQFETGKEMYVYYISSAGVIMGKEVTAGTIEAVKVRVYASYKPAMPDGKEKVVIYIQDLETWKKYQNNVTPVFEALTLDSVQGMTFTEVSNTLTALTVSVKNFDKVGVTDLSTTGAGQFILYNVTDSAAITVTGITRSGYNYTLAFTAQTASDAYTLSYQEPSVSTEYYDLETTLTGTLTA